MNGKRFALRALGLTGLLLALLAAFVAVVDPFFLLRAPGESEVYEEERYENAGLIRNLDYDTVLMGTSLVCNYRASWFDELTGARTIKITCRDGYLSDFNTFLELAFDTHPDIKTVYFGLDANILARPDSQRTTDLPGWLYDDNPFNNVEYFLNKDVYLRCANAIWQRLRGTASTLDEAYVWADGYEFSLWQAISTYSRPEISESQLPADAYFDACDENLAVVHSWVTEHPDTQFVLFFSPYSILYWDKTIREGKLDATLAMLRRAVEDLLDYDNVTLQFMMGRETIIEDLNNYTDHIHYSTACARVLTERMIQGGMFLLSRDNYEHYLEHLEEEVTGYDYEWLFSTYAPQLLDGAEE